MNTRLEGSKVVVDPRAWVYRVESHTCPLHKKYPTIPKHDCGCSGSITGPIHRTKEES